MKKILALILAMCLLSCLAACKRTPEKDQGGASSSEESSSLSSSDDEDQAVSQMPLVAISVPVITETAKAADGAVIFNYLYQNMELTLPDADVARAVITDFMNRVDTTRYTAQNIHTAAETDYNGSNSWTPYLCQITYDPMRIDYGVLSLFGSYATYQGNGRPESSYLSVSYDMTTGNALSLSSVLAEGASNDTLYQLVIAALNSQKEEKYLDEGFEAIVEDRFSGNIGDDQAWYFSQNGLCFYFSPYEIAPYASGVIVAEIPYAKLTGIVKDAYFPAERDAAKGTVMLESFNPADQDAFTQSTELITGKNGEQVLLYTSKAVYDVRIETGSWSSNGKNYTPLHTIFAAASLTPGDAVMVQSDWSEKPDLRLTYQTDNGTVTVFIDKNGLTK